MTEPHSEGWWRDHASVQPSWRKNRAGAMGQVEQWASRARTPETRAEIVRSERWEVVGIWLLCGGALGALATPVLAAVVGIWRTFDETGPSWAWFFVALGITCVLFLVGAALADHGKGRRLRALYADGQASVGRLDDVIVHPGGGDDQTTYEFLISAELAGLADADSVPLRRRLYWGEESGWVSPERWIGRRIRFRHNTLEPDDLYDVLFDGWPDREPH